MNGIYIVWVNIATASVESNNRNNRYVIIATSAQEAEEIALTAEWPMMTKKGQLDAHWRVELGRLGDYNPGITGAGLTQDAIVAIERWDERQARSQESLEREAFIHKSHMHDTEGRGDKFGW